jgi:tRNA A-37 threonylcarbamoyl transferase component Bud32
MAEEQKCAECGTKLDAGTAGGLCPKCLMKAGLQSESKPGVPPEDSKDQAAAATGPTADVSPGAVAQAAGEASTGNASPKSDRFVPPPVEELAKHFPQLEILEVLGQGGMGVVFKVRQRHLGRLAALKLLPQETARDPRFAERFTREARAMASLNHPHIVAVYDFGQADKYYYILMEYVDGTNLRHILQARDLSPDQALGIVPQVCEALQYAHGEGVVHRDIKPENILLDKRGRVKIADFGLAKLLGMEKPRTLTATNQILGTPHYMAPEQIERPAEVDHRVDIYSVGVIIYEMLTGELPLGRFAPPSQKVHIDVRLDEVVLKALAKEPNLRYQQVSEVQTDVEAISHSQVAEKKKSDKAKERSDGIGGAAASIGTAAASLGVEIGKTVRDAMPQNLGEQIGDTVRNAVAQGLKAEQPPTTEEDLRRAGSEVAAPALGLICMGILYVLTALGDLQPASWSIDPGTTATWWIAAALMFVSAGLLMNLRLLALGRAAAVLVLLAGPLFWVRLLIAIWTWTVLDKRVVKRAFDHVAAHPEAGSFKRFVEAFPGGKLGFAITALLLVLLTLFGLAVSERKGVASSLLAPPPVDQAVVAPGSESSREQLLGSLTGTITRARALMRRLPDEAVTVDLLTPLGNASDALNFLRAHVRTPTESTEKEVPRQVDALLGAFVQANGIIGRYSGPEFADVKRVLAEGEATARQLKDSSTTPQPVVVRPNVPDAPNVQPEKAP